MFLQSPRMMETLDLLRHYSHACTLQPRFPLRNELLGSTWLGKSTEAQLPQVRQGIVLHISGA